MEHQKTLNLLNEPNDSKFVTRKQDIVNDNLKTNYGVGNEIIYNTEVLKFNLCDYNHGYILGRSDITATAAPATQVAFKNCAPFTKSITEIHGATIDDAQDLQGSQWSGKTWKVVLFFKKSGKTSKSQGKNNKIMTKSGKSQNFFCHQSFF